MGRSRVFTADGMRIEYVKGRRALRLTAGEADRPVEVPLAVLVERLEIDRRDLGVEPRLLLFAGRHDQPRHGSGDLAGWFDGEDEALASFRELRVTTPDGEGWAELVTLDGGLRPAVRAWFGRPRHHPAGRARHLRLLAR